MSSSTTKVLICDDDEAILEVTALALRQDNYSVKTISKMGNLLAIVEEYAPDIILMDLQMPDMDGKKAIQALRANKATSAIPIILFSANVRIAHIADELNIPHLKKPFNISALRDIIRKHCK